MVFFYRIMVDLSELMLFQAVIWFLARWSCTYLMPAEEFGDKNSSSEIDNGPQIPSQLSKKALFRFFGEYNQGKPLLDVIVRISMAALVSYPGEKDLQVCDKVLIYVVKCF